jgi:hypothetical protein
LISLIAALVLCASMLAGADPCFVAGAAANTATASRAIAAGERALASGQGGWVLSADVAGRRLSLGVPAE